MMNVHFLSFVRPVLATVLALMSISANSLYAFDCCRRQPRAYCTPECHPTWGYHQTCWRRFPPLQPCNNWGSGDYCPACQSGAAGVPAEAHTVRVLPGNPVGGMMSEQIVSPPIAIPATPQSTPGFGPVYPTPQPMVNGTPPQYFSPTTPNPIPIPQPQSDLPAPMPNNAPSAIGQPQSNGGGFDTPMLPPTINNQQPISYRQEYAGAQAPRTYASTAQSPAVSYGRIPNSGIVSPESVLPIYANPTWGQRMQSGMARLRNSFRSPRVTNGSAFQQSVPSQMAKPSLWTRLTTW